MAESHGILVPRENIQNYKMFLNGQDSDFENTIFSYFAGFLKVYMTATQKM